MNFQEQLKYDKLQKIQKRLQLWTKTIIQTTQADVTSVMDVKTESKEIVPEIVELDSENYGAPPKNSGIIAYRHGVKRPDNKSDKVPHAYEDENWDWTYNYPGALQLARILGRTLPNIQQLMMSINAKPNRFRQYENISAWPFVSSSTGIGCIEHAFLARWTFFAELIHTPCFLQWYVRFIVDKR